MSFWERVFQSMLLLLGAWISLRLAGLVAGFFSGAMATGTTYLVMTLAFRSFANDTTNLSGICLACAIVVGVMVFWKTFRWFATLGGLLRRR